MTRVKVGGEGGEGGREKGRERKKEGEGRSRECRMGREGCERVVCRKGWSL
jgi:hypothetical protein